MSAVDACPGHFLPKKRMCRNLLRGCTSRKRDNFVLIEVDSDDFGDVIILDVPESFQEKFRKKPKHVINIDDDDDDDANNSESKSAACNQDYDATACDRSSPTSVAHPSKSVDTDHDSGSEGNTPVKLSKSKRMYSGRNVSRNRYGFSSDDKWSADNSDYSDCEFVGESSRRTNEQKKKAPFTESHDSCRSFGENIAGSSAPNKHDHNGTKEFTREHSELPGQPSNRSAENLVENLTPSNTGGCLNHNMKESCSGCADEPAEGCNSTHKDEDAEGNGIFIGANSANFIKTHLRSVVSSCHASSPMHGDPSSLLDDNSDYGCEGRSIESLSTNVQYCCLMTDREKMKETDEYKCAMEEEWAARNHQLRLQAEEVRKLRNRKRAENMRIKANERRQMERLEEMRETRRKDQENLNLKDQLRLEIRNELRKLEQMSSDMSSLLRCLGIHIGSLYPSPKEIQVAYKRACLKFHPDRYVKSNLREQVEAEEKFKLISNMKDKLLFK